MIITDCIFAVEVQVQNCCTLMQGLFTQVPRRSMLLVILIGQNVGNRVSCLSWDFIWSTSYKRSCLVHFLPAKPLAMFLSWHGARRHSTIAIRRLALEFFFFFMKASLEWHIFLLVDGLCITTELLNLFWSRQRLKRPWREFKDIEVW